MSFPRSTTIILLAVLVIGNNHVCCQSTGGLLNDLEPDVVSDILSILINGTVHITGNCSNDSGVQNKYWLYTKQNPNEPTELISYEQIKPDRPIFFLIHGWRGNRDVAYMQVIKDAYVRTFDCNVIVVDWGAYAGGNYFGAYCNVPLVGEAVARYISDMCFQLKVPFSDVHVVGHSLGAQVAGIMGNAIKMNGTIGRITGLDPAGPLYQGVGVNERLDKSDADFVDVIHTNQMAYGYTGDCGDVDFYPNCGYVQLGCLKGTVGGMKMNSILQLPLNLVLCNHQRSCDLYAESILYNDFPSLPCSGCGISTVCVPEPNILSKRAFAYMGYYSAKNLKHQDYMLMTKSTSPYGSNNTILKNVL